MCKEVVNRINEKLVNTIKELVNQYNLQCTVGDLKHFKSNKTEIFEQPIQIVYKSDIFQEKLDVYLQYRKTYKFCINLIVSNTLTILICKKSLNFTNKDIDKIKAKLIDELDSKINTFIELCKEFEKEEVIKKAIYEAIVLASGLKPADIVVNEPKFIVRFERFGSPFNLFIEGVIDKDTIKIKEITIVDTKNNALTLCLPHIIEIYKIIKASYS